MRALFTKQVFIDLFFFFFLIFRTKKNVLEKIVNKHCVSVFLVQSLWIGLICGLSCQTSYNWVQNRQYLHKKSESRKNAAQRLIPLWMILGNIGICAAWLLILSTIRLNPRK